MKRDLPEFRPSRVLEIELDQALPSLAAFDPITGRRYDQVMALVRLHTHPLGTVELEIDHDGLTAAQCARQIWQCLQPAIISHLRGDGLPEVGELSASGLLSAVTPACLRAREQLLADAPFVSVIVPTRDRPEKVATCVRRLLSLKYPNFEIIIVDNAPGTSATADIMQELFAAAPKVRYIREDRPGKSWAFNHGLSEARGEIVACTDDDVIVDEHWLAALVQGFELADNVVCVTGLVLPAELETPAQVWFEQFGGFNKGMERRILDANENRMSSPLYPYAGGAFGSGNNMAFKASFLRGVGGFDPALGPSTPAYAGEDLALYFEVIAQGYTLVYEPAAVVYHVHRRDYKGLRKQIYAYGVGLAAYLTKCVVDDPRRLLDVLVKIPAGVYYGFSPRSSKNSKKQADYPKELAWAEIVGMLLGPIAYLRGYSYLRRVARRPRRLMVSKTPVGTQKR